MMSSDTQQQEHMDLTEQIKQLALDVGYADCGIAGAEPFAEFEQALDRMIDKFPESAGHYEGMRGRIDPRGTAPWCNALVVCIRRYGKYELPPEPIGHIGRNYLADRRYAGHPESGSPKRMKEGLKELGLRVKVGGVPERWAGIRAGVGRFGRNCFVTTSFGSWINIETFRIDAELPADEATTDCPCPDGCTACIDACPTGALSEPFTMCMDKCIAHLTYGASEPIDPELEAKMGEWVYGCDVCQDVCPLNKGKWESLEPAEWQKSVAKHLTPEALAEMDEQTYREIVHPRFWYISEDDIARWHANARRALGRL